MKLHHIIAGLALAAACMLTLSPAALAQQNEKVPPVAHPKVGTTAQSKDGGIKLTITGQKQNFAGCNKALQDTDVWSPKSVHFMPGGKKYYVNSLEGCLTVVYDAATNKKIGVIKHHFIPQNEYLWAKPSGLFPFTHYGSKGRMTNYFWGRPVESCFSHGGRYLWVPYYRRDFDLNAQDPSAIAVIDTRADTLVRVLETGPLPKMVALSPDGKTLAVTHWGNNTVGFIDVHSNNPKQWRWLGVVAVDKQLKLNFSLTVKVDRDNHSGYLLRGTVFTPDGRYLLVGCMGGAGGIAVIEVPHLRYVGRLTGLWNARHLVISHNYLYLSINNPGIVQRMPLSQVLDAVKQLEASHKRTLDLSKGWEQCAVGRGARTISVSPDGRWVFAACNAASAIYVVDTKTMTVATSIAVDSYPVGLDLSADGSQLIVTSQGRKGHGGNAVTLISVDYAQPQPAPSDSTAAVMKNGVEQAREVPFWPDQVLTWWQQWHKPVAVGLALLAALVVVWLIAWGIRRHERNKEF